MAADQAHSIALADKGMELAEVEGDIARDVQAGEIFRDTIHAQSAASGHPLIDGALRFVRPLLTVYLLGVLSYLGISLHLIVGGLETLPQNELISMYKHVIEQIVFMAVTATFWWFGVRGVSKK